MKEQILELRAKGYSYNKIVEELGCSKGTVAYHCGAGQKEKTLNRQRKHRESSHSAIKKLQHFTGCAPKIEYAYKDIRSQLTTNIKDKIRKFHGRITKDERGSFDYDDFIEWLEDNPKCYLSGRTIDFSNPRLYHFDHIIPRSAGGTSEIDNLGLTTADANQAKGSLSLEEFIILCMDVLENFGIIEITEED
jgi:5-methylcytosine-specific restriction endonuclease McrA